MQQHIGRIRGQGDTVPAVNPDRVSQGPKRRDQVGELETLAALLLWLQSGTQLPFSAGNEDIVVALGAGVLGLFALRGRLSRLRRVWGLIGLALCFLGWAAIRSVHLLDMTQWYPAAGHLLKLAMVAFFLMGATRPLDALIRAMVWIAVIALAIFAMRQGLRLTIGYDIADLFDAVYPFTGVLPDRSLILFNFDIPSEAGRNSGAFREPGMFAANLVLALMLMLSPYCQVKSSLRLRYLIVLVAALLSTQSTMGLATLPLLLAIAYASGRKLGRVRLLALGVAVAVLGGGIWVTGGQNEKIQGSSIYGQSGGWHTSRLGNAVVDWRAIEGRPILGYGFAEAGRPILWEGSESVGFGNGLTGTVVKFGFGMGGLLYVLFALCLFRMMRNPFAALLAVAVFGMILIGQQLLTLPAIHILLANLRPLSPRRATHRLRSPGPEPAVLAGIATPSRPLPEWTQSRPGRPQSQWSSANTWKEGPH